MPDLSRICNAPLQGHWASDDQFEANEDSVQLRSQNEIRRHTPDFYTYPNTQHWFFETIAPNTTPKPRNWPGSAPSPSCASTADRLDLLGERM